VDRFHRYLDWYAKYIPSGAQAATAGKPS
jgi:hypothetical protein